MKFNATIYLLVVIGITTPLSFLIATNLLNYIRSIYILQQEVNTCTNNFKNLKKYMYHKLWTQALITADNQYTIFISQNNELNYEYTQQVHAIYKQQGLATIAKKYRNNPLKNRDSRI